MGGGLVRFRHKKHLVSALTDWLSGAVDVFPVTFVNVGNGKQTAVLSLMFCLLITTSLLPLVTVVIRQVQRRNLCICLNYYCWWFCHLNVNSFGTLAGSTNAVLHGRTLLCFPLSFLSFQCLSVSCFVWEFASCNVSLSVLNLNYLLILPTDLRQALHLYTGKYIQFHSMCKKLHQCWVIMVQPLKFST